MTIFTRRLVVLLAGALLGAGAGLSVGPAFAQTYFERVTGTVCKATVPTGTSDKFAVGTTWSGVYNDAASVAHFVCHVPDKSDLMQGNISEIRIDVDDGNNDVDVTVDARVCAFDSEDSSSGSCGDWEKTDSTSTFQDTTTVVLESAGELAPLSVTGDPATAETAYVWIKLPAKDGSVVSSINALYFEDD